MSPARKQQAQYEGAGFPARRGYWWKTCTEHHHQLQPYVKLWDVGCIEKEAGNLSFHAAWASAKAHKGRGQISALCLHWLSAGLGCPLLLLQQHLSTPAANKTRRQHLQQHISITLNTSGVDSEQENPQKNFQIPVLKQSGIIES